MGQYPIELAKAFLEVASSTYDTFIFDKSDAHIRSCGDICILKAAFCNAHHAIEGALKATLEPAGFDEKVLREAGHDLLAILDLFSALEVEIQDSSSPYFRSASDIHAECVQDKTGRKRTLGQIIETVTRGGSPYPSELRYGQSLRHIEFDLWLKTAQAAITYHDHNVGKIRFKQPVDPNFLDRWRERRPGCRRHRALTSPPAARAS